MEFEKKYIINYSKDELLEKLNKILVHFNMSIIVSGEHIKISDKKIDDKYITLKIKEIELENQSFSVTIGEDRGLIISIEASSDIEYFKGVLGELDYLENIYSNNQVSAIKRDMPLLTWYSLQKEKSLVNVAIIWRDHFLEENIGLLGSLVKMGVNPGDILALDKGDSTKHRKKIRDTFKYMGFMVDVFDNAFLTDELYVTRVKDKLDDFITRRKNKAIIIIDDGAIVSKMYCDSMPNNIVGVIELTEMGLRRMKNLDLKCPVFNIAKTKLKRCITYPEIANSIFLRIIELLGAEKVVGRPVLICGYGDMGEILAERFRSFGANVLIYDVDVFRLIVAAEKGYSTFVDPVCAVKNMNPFLIVGASGENSISEDMINNIGTNAYISAGATGDLAVFKKLDNDDNVVKIRKKKYGTQYVIDGKVLTVLGNGRSVNLFDSEAIPNKSNDIFKVAVLVAAYNIIQSTKQQRVHHGMYLDIVDKWITESGLYEKYYSLYYQNKVTG